MTKTQRVLQYIVEYSQQYPGNSPTRREIVSGTGIKSLSNVSIHLDKLVEAGKLEEIRPPGRKSRIFCVVGSLWVKPEQVKTHRSFFDRYFDGFEL